jgi:hypothetical protein
LAAGLCCRGPRGNARGDENAIGLTRQQRDDVARRIAHEFDAVAWEVLLRKTQIPERLQLLERLWRRGECENAVGAQSHLHDLSLRLVIPGEGFQ